MSKCCRKKKSRSQPNRRESRKSQPPMSKHNQPPKNHIPLDAEERATIANLMKNIFQRFVPHEPDLTEPIEPRNTPFGNNRLQNIKHILDARATQCKAAYLAKKNISTLKDASGDDPLVAKKNPFASHADQDKNEPLVAKKDPFASDTAQDEESLVAEKNPFVPHTDQNEEPLIAKKNPPPAWGETPLIGKNESRSLRPEVDDGPRPPGRPLWMPEGTDLERMPVEVRQAVAEILRPAYEELVVQAGSGMEKSLGTSLVHLLWLEILEQYDMKKDYCKCDLLLGLDGTRGFAIDRYLKLVNSKLRLSSMLTRLRQLRLKEQKSSTQPSNVQKQEFDDENKMPDSPNKDLKPKAQDQKVQNPNFAHENQTTESPSQSQMWKNSDLAPKTDSSLPLPSTTFSDQKALKVQKQEFDDEIQIPNSPTQDPNPKAQDQNVQNPKFAHENQRREILSQDPNSTSQPQAWKNNDSAPKNDLTPPTPDL